MARRSSNAAPAPSRTTCTPSPGRSSCTASLGELATDYWRTPRYATGRYPVPQTGNGHKRHPITVAELDVPEGHAFLDLPPFREIKPDLSLELRIPSLRLTFDLLVELDLTGRPSYNHDKLRAYDAFLTGWALAHPRYRALGTRPVVVFVCRDHRTALACAQKPTALLTGRTGAMGTAARDWYYAGRDHIFFAAEPDIYHDSLRAFALPPPSARSPRTASRQPPAAGRRCRPATASGHARTGIGRRIGPGRVPLRGGPPADPWLARRAGWVLENERMAFPAHRRTQLSHVRPSEDLLLYTTRGCFPTRRATADGIIGRARVHGADMAARVPRTASQP